MKFKVGVWILPDYSPQIGGGFSLYERIIKLIDDYQFSEELEICFVGHLPKNKFSFKKEYISIYPFPFYSKYITDYSHKSSFIGKREGDILRKNKVEVIYYPVQGHLKVRNFPFVSANWDVGHLSGYAFPEVALNNRFEYRDKWYTNDIYKALMVFAESEAGKHELLNYCRLNPSRIGIVPLFPGGLVNCSVDISDQLLFLRSINVEKGKYFFYPAQFWAHKNHYNLLLAFKKFVQASPDYKLVLTGSDKGNKTYIKETAGNLDLKDKIIFTGFVSNEHVYSLYKNARALVMPSFTGPTNMPLLEARALDCPVLCSDFPGHREIMKEGAFFFEPADPASIFSALEMISDDKVVESLLIKARSSMKDTIFTESNALHLLNENLIKVKSIRKSWGENDKIF